MKKLIVQNVEAGIVPLSVKIVEVMVALAHVVVESKIGYVEELNVLHVSIVC